MTEAVLRGGCHCGAIRYEAVATPFNETLCHCGDCRRVSGAPAVAWFTVPRDAFRVTAGDPRTYRSSGRAKRRFCGECGTPLTFEADATPDEVDVTTATLDEPDRVPPRSHSHGERRVAWDHLSDALPQRR